MKLKNRLKNGDTEQGLEEMRRCVVWRLVRSALVQLLVPSTIGLSEKKTTFDHAIMACVVSGRGEVRVVLVRVVKIRVDIIYVISQILIIA